MRHKESTPSTLGSCAALTSLVLAALLLLPGAASAQPLLNDFFQINDANPVDDPEAVADDDWQNVYCNTNPGAPAIPCTNIDPSTAVLDFFVIDGVDDSDVTRFTGGQTKDTNDISQWQQDPGAGLQDKNNLAHVGAAAYATPNGDGLLYLFADLFAENGAATLSFWLLQDPTFAVGPGSGFTGAHVDGDILVQINFENGGVAPDVDVFVWLSGSLTAINELQDVECGSGVNANTVGCAITNSENENTPWPYTSKDGTPNVYPPTTFVEVGVNLTDLLEQISGGAGCFGTFLASTRSAPSQSSTLSDFAFGNTALCGLDVEKTGDPLSKPTDEVTYTITIRNTGIIPLTLDSVDDSLLGDVTTEAQDACYDLDGQPDTNDDTALVGDTECSFQVTRTVLANDPNPLLNTVTVNALAPNGQPYVDPDTLESPIDSHSVALFTPSVSVTKSANPTVAGVGDTVSYSVEVENTSSANAPDLVLLDTCATASPCTGDTLFAGLYAEAVADGCDTIASGATCTISYDYTIQAGDLDANGDVINTATLVYSPDGFPNEISGSDSATVAIGGIIEIEKQTLPDGSAQLFSFNSTPDIIVTDLSDDDVFLSDLLAAGSYSVTELVPAGWELTALSCDDGNSTVPSTVDLASATASIELEPGETVRCTYTNTQLGSITIDKSALGGNADFEFDTDGDTGTTEQTIGNGESFTLDGLLPDDYLITEIIPAGWNLTDLTCTGQNGSTVVFIDAPDGTNSPTDDFEAGIDDSVLIGLAAGENIDCNFENTALSSITILKTAAPADGTDFAFTGTGTGISPGSFTLDVDADPTFEDRISFTDLLPGNFSFSETPIPQDWLLTNIGCQLVGGGTPTSVASFTGATGGTDGFESGDDTANIALEPGEDLICAFQNTLSGTLSITKIANGKTEGETFTFTTTGLLATDLSALNGAIGNLQSLEQNGVPSDTYTITETLLDGWALTNISCTSAEGTSTFTYGGDATFEPGDTEAGVDFASGDTVACTFVNTELGSITIEKQTEPDGSAQSFTFTPSVSLDDTQTPFDLQDDGTQSFPDLLPGAYNVTETLPSGWRLPVGAIDCTAAVGDTLSDFSRSGSSPDIGVDIQLVAGEDLTCTFTNQQLGSAMVTKTVAGAADDTAWSFDFELTGPGGSTQSISGTGNTSDSTSWADLTPGEVYTLTEVDPGSAWAPGVLICDNGGEALEDLDATEDTSFQFTMPVGGMVSCTITNTLLPDISHTKTVSSAPVDNGDGTFTVGYQVEVTNAGGNGVYDLDDTPLPPAGVTFTVDSVTAQSTGSNDPGPNINGGFDGDADPVLITNQAIDASAVHTYTITVTFDVTALVPADGDCNGDPNNGFFNRAILTLPNEDPVNADACADVPPILDMVKSSAVPTLEGLDLYDVVYTVTVTNSGGLTGSYDLSDAPQPPAAVDIVSAQAQGATDGPNLPQTLGWDGAGNSQVVTDQDIAPGETHTYTLTVRFDVAGLSSDPTAGACDIEEGAGFGFFNGATLTAGDLVIDDDDCQDIPATIRIIKQSINGTGSFGFTGDLGAFSIDTAVLATATFSNQVPGQYAVTEDSLPPLWFFVSASCTDDSPVDGQTATIDLQAGERVDCTFVNEFPPPLIVLEKMVDSVTAESLEDRLFRVTYTITATNSGGPGLYDLTDTPDFSPGVSIVSATLAVDGGTPADITLTDGVTTVLAESVSIGNGETDTYTVEVIVELTATEPGTIVACGVEPTANQGLFNSTTLSYSQGDLTDEVCPDVPGLLTLEKTVTSLQDNGSGDFTVSYAITVVNIGGSAIVYDLDDTPDFSDGITINSATVAFDGGAPAGITLTDGAPTNLATDVSLPAGESDVYALVVEISLDNPGDPASITACAQEPQPGEGLFNSALLTADNGQELEDNDCDTPEFSPPPPPPPAEPKPIPTLGQWGLITLASLMALITLVNLRRRRG